MRNYNTPHPFIRFANSRPLPQGERYPYQLIHITPVTREDEILQLDTSPLVGEVASPRKRGTAGEGSYLFSIIPVHLKIKRTA